VKSRFGERARTNFGHGGKVELKKPGNSNNGLRKKNGRENRGPHRPRRRKGRGDRGKEQKTIGKPCLLYLERTEDMSAIRKSFDGRREEDWKRGYNK